MDKNEFQKIIDEISFPIDGYVLYTIKDKKFGGNTDAVLWDVINILADIIEHASRESNIPAETITNDTLKLISDREKDRTEKMIKLKEFAKENKDEEKIIDWIKNNIFK